MTRLQDLSLKYKVPLRVAVLVIVTAVVLAATLIYRGIDDLRNDLIDNADKMGLVIANNLVEPMLHDDVWRSFEIINTPYRVQTLKTPDEKAGYILILNASNKVYASTQPDRFPMLKDPAAIDPRYSELLKALPDLRDLHPTVIDPHKSDDLFLLIPIQSEQMRIGTLVMSYPKSPFTSRFYRLAKDAVLITLLVLIVLLPLGIYWGQKMAAPLLQLSDAMNKISPDLPEPREIMLEESGDEIGKLGKSFKSMIAELKEKEQLQQQVITTDRLAALGRLAAGVAHEINNPLGGMLNAISTFKRHGEQDPITLKTLSILERGLLQIKETVAALLVEAKAQTHPFNLNDVADICTLVQPDIEKKHVNFTREIDIIEAQPISSTLVRQVTINLLLNAFHATQQHGQVHLHIYRDSLHLYIDVQNNGSHIPQDRVSYLFEPFTSLSEGGSGLGLWVIYQIVQQLGGLIKVQSEPDKTQFTIQLPLEKQPE